MKKETINWLKVARNDLKVAATLFEEELYLNVIEHSHAALEKLIKGIIVEQKSSTPPRVHNLLKLISMTLIQNIQEDLKNTLEKLDDAYFSIRYPEDFDSVQSKFSKEEVKQIFTRVKEVYNLLEKSI